MTIILTISFSDDDTPKVEVIKVGSVFPMVISSEFRMRQYIDDDHREDAPHFTVMVTVMLVTNIWGWCLFLRVGDVACHQPKLFTNTFSFHHPAQTSM